MMATSRCDQQSTTALSTAIPSYARQTAASDGRRALNTRAALTTDTLQKRTVKHPEPLPPSTPRRRFNARQMSTSARPRTGFFDLPAELRNTIYEIIYPPRIHRRLNFHSGRLQKHPTHAIPAFLRADKRLLQEAASYYFSDGRFEILLGQGNSTAFFKWLAAIGAINQTRLARNPSITIRFVHDVKLCRDAGHFLPSGFMSVDKLMAAPDREAERPLRVRLAQTKFPAVGGWNLAPTCQAAARAFSRDSVLARFWCEAHPVKRFNVALTTEMRELVERVYEVLGSVAVSRPGGVRSGKRGVRLSAKREE